MRLSKLNKSKILNGIGHYVKAKILFTLNAAICVFIYVSHKIQLLTAYTDALAYHYVLIGVI